jgi:hypothetical protein
VIGYIMNGPFQGVSLHSVYFFMFMSESSSTCAQYVALAKENWMKESHNMPVWLRIMVLAQHFLHDSEAGTWHSRMVLAPAFATGCRGWYMAQQSVTSAADWLDRLIGPGGLLLVVTNQCAVPVLVLWVKLGKKVENRT